jgi:hypothetical protein
MVQFSGKYHQFRISAKAKESKKAKSKSLFDYLGTGIFVEEIGLVSMIRY